jgi:5-methylcytosine-specific restriction protein A
MPFAAKRPCGKTGCSALVSDTHYCDDHAELSKQADRWRGTAASRGYDSGWRRVRLQALKRDHYLCQHCLTAGQVTSAADVHHILKLTAYPHLRLVLTNLVSLCKGCHAKLTANGQ